MGGDRRVRADQGRLLRPVPAARQRHPQPGHLFERVFAELAPGAFSRAFGRWMAAACEATGLVPIAIDGKSARAAKRGTATGCLHVVTAWAAENRLVLGTSAKIVVIGSGGIGRDSWFPPV